MDPRPLNIPFEVAGEWHLPHAPEQRIGGILRYAPDGTTVHLSGSFEPWLEAYQRSTPKRYDVVFGKTRDGDQVTLVNAVLIASVARPDLEPHRADDLFTTRVIFGAHLAADHAFWRMRCRIPGLQIWLSQEVVERRFERDGSTKLLSQTYRAVGLPNEEFLVETMPGRVVFETPWRVANESRTSVTITTDGWLSINSPARQTVDWLLATAISITELLSLCAGSGMSPDCIETYNDESGSPSYQMIALNESRLCEFSEEHDFFCRRNGLGIELGHVLSNWFGIYPKIETAAKLAVSIFLSSHRWAHSEFILLTQALEGVHRAVLGGRYMESGEYEPIKDLLWKAIPSSVSPSHRRSLKSRIQYGYEFSFGKRLNDLAGRLPDVIRRHVLGGDGKVPRRWIHTRNYYTHWDESSRGDILAGDEMIYVNLRLRAWLRILYLQVAGIPDAAIAAALGRPSRQSRDIGQANLMDRHSNTA